MAHLNVPIDAMLSIDPADCRPRQVYKLMTGIIVPRPVALVSTLDRNGVPNLAPFSFFTGVGSNPPTVLFCPVVRTPGAAAFESQTDLRKDTLRNVEETGEFVVNVVSDAIAAAANASAAEVPPEVDEFVLSGLTPQPSQLVRPPRVAESPAQMECKLLQVIYTGHAPRRRRNCAGRDCPIPPAQQPCGRLPRRSGGPRRRRPHGGQHLGTHPGPHRIDPAHVGCF